MTEEKKYVLACLDGSLLSETVLDYATWFATQLQLPLRLVHRIEHHSVPAHVDLTGAIGLGASEDLLNELAQTERNRSKLLMQKGSLMLKAARHKAQADGVEVVIDQEHGLITEALIEQEPHTQVIVLGIRGQSHESEPESLGTQIESMIRSVHKPILVATHGFSEPKNIMLAYNASEACKKAIDTLVAGELIAPMPCHLVHSTDKPYDEGFFAQAKEALTARGFEVTTAFVQGNPEESLAEYQTQHDISLMLMGAFSHSMLRGLLLGSFTVKMLQKSKRPLLLLR